jgi:kumamolisin
METTHVSVAGSNRVPLPGAHALGRANSNAVLEVTLKLRRKAKLPELNGRPAKVLTRAELANSYGASKDDIDKTVATFGALGLKCVASDAATRTVRLSGTVAAFEKAFAVKLFNYSHPGGHYRGRVGSVHTPEALKDIVVGVFGLDNRQVAHRRRHVARDTAQAKHPASIPSAWYTSGELASHYQFPPGDGSGETIGLLEFGGGYFESDLKHFCALAKVSMPTVKAISTDGTSTSAKDGAEGEVMLDIEVVAGVCPKATIAVYFAQFTEQGWITALDAAIQDKEHDPGVLSASWGYAEDADIWTKQAMDQLNETLQEAAHLGITVCIAAGDDGSSDAIMDGSAHVDFPGSSPFVLSVGGTTVPTKGGPLPDIVWKEGDGLRADNGGSTGGGVSAVFPRPTWQAEVNIVSVNAGAIAGRCVPDLAANADWDASPYLLFVDGQAQPNGGTSAATPLMASLIALINAKRGSGKRVGYLTPVLYQSAGKGGQTIGSIACADVLTGDNTTAKTGGYTAGRGYDAASGWGTPFGVKLLAAIPSP